jgi:hypothetical protein
VVFTLEGLVPTSRRVVASVRQPVRGATRQSYPIGVRRRRRDESQPALGPTEAGPSLPRPE